ncbi:squamosa promoter-binding-like protein 1 [Punica granatum]|uniref:SBP-type domain-containing protein n=2 Tax=Punica granatum TaxID=22663 RepID=A0A218X3C8_PUNGR|nr:squamosa promoter-binding-like protein 1 [Punica granatum]OWM79735.1 hypothetical protein CDL15_Pgr023147 [Punica granatum]PKI68638.1 hypothetical protein CRG98_010918 [Punica granatum]
MEARIEAEAHHYYGMASVGKRSLEWNLNDWKWDGDLFIARPLNPVPSDYLGQQFFPLGNGIPTAGNSSNSSSSCSDEANLGFENGKRELEKRRRVIVVEHDNLDDKANGLTLKLGEQGYPIAEREAGIWEGNSGKKAKVVGGSASRAVCQVEDCGADLSNAKDYHRRHKVCEMHSKASRALVGNIMQRFCQQCSRFHALQEFDEGKRSCRRRLAGHNKRRRKTNPDAAATANPLNDDQASGYLLISLLKILSNMHTNPSKQSADQDLLTHLLRSLASNQIGGKNISGLLQESQNIASGGASLCKSEAIPAVVSKGLEGPSRSPKLPQAQPTPCDLNGVQSYTEGRNPTGRQSKLNKFDLNDVYVDSDDGLEDLERSPVPANPRTDSLDCPSWMQQESHQSSPPQTSGTSDSASALSPSSSSGDTQSRTDRIVFKLFGKEPNDFPLLVRAQIFDWLSHSPTDIESYIRPGCVILTIYLRQCEDAWEELSDDLGSSLSRLIDVSEDSFWKTGWMYIRVQHQMAFIYNGQLVLDTLLPSRSINHSNIVSVRPIAVSASEKTQFLVKGFNLCNPSSRLLCALEGKYLLQEATQDLLDEDNISEHDELRSVKFSCSIPAVTGRGFIEIEDRGLPGSFFPFIVAEADVCSEIRTLEGALELIGTDSDIEGTTEIQAKDQVLEFINEMGWILHRSGLRSRLGQLDPNTELFSFRRFRWLVEFSMDHDWCAVVKKLLDILFDGIVGAGEHPKLYLAVLEMGLVHRAVRRNCKPLVELLLRYIPQWVSDNVASELRLLSDGKCQIFLFRPDAVGPAGLTPLHIAAGKDGSEDVLDALTDDPGMVGVEAWKNARDSTGSTPEDYARLRGHYSYIHLVQRKLNRRALPPQASHVVLDIPDSSNAQQSHSKDTTTTSSFEIGKIESSWKPGHRNSCRMCGQKLAYGIGGRSLLYRPAMLSMVAIAAVCVCVALLFKSSPEVLYVFRPFRWELLEYGAS